LPEDEAQTSEEAQSSEEGQTSEEALVPIPSKSDDHLSISNEEEFFSAQEDAEDEEESPTRRTADSGVSSKALPRLYTADTGGSIRCGDLTGEDMIATTVTLAAIRKEEEEEDDGYFIGQASPSDSDIQQMISSSSSQSIGAVSNKAASSHPRPFLGAVDSNAGSCGPKLEVDPEHEADPAMLTITKATPITTQPVLSKTLQVVVPKLLHRDLSNELKRLKPSPVPSPDRSVSPVGRVSPSPLKNRRKNSHSKRSHRSSNSEESENRYRVRLERKGLSSDEERGDLISVEGSGHKSQRRRKNHVVKKEAFDSEEESSDQKNHDVFQDSDGKALEARHQDVDNQDSVALQSDTDVPHGADSDRILQDSSDEVFPDSSTLQDGALQDSDHDKTLQDSSDEKDLQDRGAEGELQDKDDSPLIPATPTSKSLNHSPSSDDITFSDFNLSPAQSPSVKQSHTPSPNKTSVKSTNADSRSLQQGSDDDDFDMTLSYPPNKTSVRSDPRSSHWGSDDDDFGMTLSLSHPPNKTSVRSDARPSHWGSDDDDFDMTFSHPPSSRKHTPSSSRRNKKKKTLRKVSSDEDERPLLSSSKGKNDLMSRLRRCIKKEKFDRESDEDREPKAAKSKKRLDFLSSSSEGSGGKRGNNEEDLWGGPSGTADTDLVAAKGGSTDARDSSLSEVEGGEASDDVAEMGRSPDDVTEVGGGGPDGASLLEGVRDSAVTNGFGDLSDAEGSKTSNSKHARESVSSHGETTPTLEVNIKLSQSSLAKLGKHTKGQHGKGKEKAPRRPDVVMCCACGQHVNWREQKIHAHPRLNVIVCQVSEGVAVFSTTPGFCP
jgi:hypothetical protein